ncbi:MAG: hypothetical protein ACOC44_14335 [Promethearchaeia archaeon]
MEKRILNVIYSIAKGKEPLESNRILELVHEVNKDLIISGVELLLSKEIIIPIGEKQKGNE